MQEWVESQPENKKKFFDQRKIYDAIILHKSEEELMELVNNKSHKKIKYFNFLKEGLKVASILLIAFIAAWFFLDSKDQDKLIAQTQTIHVPAGQRVNITLPDGTNVWLNSLTSVEYPIFFNSKTRTVKRDGQAYFDVAPNKNIPFIVETEK